MPIVQPRPAFVSTRSIALRRRTHHQFVPGIGYIAHAGPPELPPTANGRENCAPPGGTEDQSLHLLKPPGGAPPLAMVWHAGERAWGALKPEKGNRLAWSTDYLMRAGWKYVSVAPAVIDARAEEAP